MEPPEKRRGSPLSKEYVFTCDSILAQGVEPLKGPSGKRLGSRCGKAAQCAPLSEIKAKVRLQGLILMELETVGVVSLGNFFSCLGLQL